MPLLAGWETPGARGCLKFHLSRPIDLGET